MDFDAYNKSQQQYVKVIEQLKQKNKQMQTQIELLNSKMEELKLNLEVHEKKVSHY